MVVEYAFPGQKKDEPIYIFLRRHIIAFLPVFLLILAMAIVPLLILLFAIPEDIFSGLTGNIVILGAAFYYLVLMTFCIIAWIDFYFDIYILTDRRIIDIEQKGLFNRDISELTLEQVEDVSSHITGILPTFFDFGNVEVQTAGTQRNFSLNQVSRPREVAAMIVDLLEQCKAHPGEPAAPRGKVKAIINGRLFEKEEETKTDIKVAQEVEEAQAIKEEALEEEAEKQQEKSDESKPLEENKEVKP